MTKTGEYYKNHAIKTKYGFDRVVEDLIQEAMSKGQFNNLPGSGKPLTSYQRQNPYVDFVTHKLNNILIDNGFTPEWIMLQKEIRIDLENLKTKLKRERTNIGQVPLTPDDSEKWNLIMERHKKLADDINKKVDKYNLIVPVLDKQMFRVRLNIIADRILNVNKSVVDDCGEPNEREEKPKSNKKEHPDKLLKFLGMFFR